MNKFLKAASERYPKEFNSQLIHPLSKEDAEIIAEIGEILKKANLIEVVTILNQYKYLKDSEILEALLKWLTESLPTQEPVTDEETGTKPIKSSSGSLYTRNFIYFKDFRLDLRFICAYEKQDEYDFVKREMSYIISINDIPATTEVRNPTSHKVVKYPNIEQRDRDFEMLDSYMADFPGIHFINKR